MKIAFIAGSYSTKLHGQIDADGLYEARALTGSESSFFNAAWGLTELGHEIDIYCDVITPVKNCAKLAGANVYSINAHIPGHYDAYVSLNEPQQLTRVPEKALRVVQHQLNDFYFLQPDFKFDNFVDIYAFLSPVQRDHILGIHPNITKSKATWIPNSTNISMYGGKDIARVPHSMAWCSSPDRGLHRLLELFPAIRKKVPDATLNIFYRFDPWYQRVKEDPGKLGARARFIGECLRRVGSRGENGVTLVGPVANVKMAEALLATHVLPYTCECISFTEGFSVSIMDACAAGCVPIISDADAIGDIYANVARVIEGRPEDKREEWIEMIVRAMTDQSWAKEIALRAHSFAQHFDRKKVARYWESLLEQNVGHKDEFKWSTPASVKLFVEEAEKNAQPDSQVSAQQVATPQIIAPPNPHTIISPGKLHRIAVILGKLSSSVHGIFDIENLYDTGMLTGTGSGFFDIVWGLAERGHIVDVFCEAKHVVIGAPLLAGANVYPIDSVKMGDDYDAYISINEPDPLRAAPKDRLRICAIWLNDFSFAQPGYDEAVDLYVSPSETHARELCRASNVSLDKVIVNPLSVSLEFFNKVVPRRPASIAYCSSPDRGLHHILNFFPRIKAAVPEASLRIYYRFQPWYDYASRDMSDHGAIMRQRAESINTSFQQLGRDGENGVFLIGPVARRAMAHELLATRVLAYPCDPVRFTEGFSISVLDACAAGCVPIVAAVDALPEVYRGAVYFIPGNPALEQERWIEAIVAALTDDNFADGVRLPAKTFAAGFSRHKIAARWEKIIYERKKDVGPR